MKGSGRGIVKLGGSDPSNPTAKRVIKPAEKGEENVCRTESK